MNMKDFLKELEIYTKYFSPEALAFYEILKKKADNIITEKGKKILICMQDNREKYKTYSSKTLGDLLCMSPRSVSGAMKKLINEGYINKIVGNPVVYELTDLGKELHFDN